MCSDRAVGVTSDHGEGWAKSHFILLKCACSDKNRNSEIDRPRGPMVVLEMHLCLSVTGH